MEEQNNSFKGFATDVTRSHLMLSLRTPPLVSLIKCYLLQRILTYYYYNNNNAFYKCQSQLI